MNDNKLIAQALLEVAQRATTTFLEVGKEDKELIAAAKKIGIELPSPDLLVMKTVYAEIDKVNKNGVILPKKAVKEGLKTLVGKQCNWEHSGSGFVCGYTISAKINEDKIETINVLFKSLFPEQADELKEKVKSGEAAVSFEIWNRNPDTKKSVVQELDNGFKQISPIIFHGTGVLLAHKPACPNAKIFKLVADNLTKTAEKIVNRVFEEDLIYASLALENIDESSFQCECLKCGKIINSDKHCKDIKCPECGGEMRRKDRPGKGQPNKADLEKLYSKVKKEEDINFDLAMAFYYATDEAKNKLTEDAAKWTRKFINDLPDSAFAVIEPDYPEKTQDKNARHLPHHNGSGDLGKNKSNKNLDLSHYKNALARANQIKPITDSISVEDLRAKAQAHLERHKDALDKANETMEKEVKQVAEEIKNKDEQIEKKNELKESSEKKTQTEEKIEVKEESTETKTEEKSEVIETKVEEQKNEVKEESQESKVEETKSEETKDKEPEVEPKETSEEKKRDSAEEKTDLESISTQNKEEIVQEEKDEEKAQELETVEPKIVVKVISEYREVRTSTFIDGTPSGEDETKAYTKKITEYKDGTKDEIEEEVEIKKKYDFAEVEAKIKEAVEAKEKEIKELKDKEIEDLKKELGNKDQEIAKLTPKDDEIKEELEVGAVDDNVDEDKQRAQKIDEIIATKHKR